MGNSLGESAVKLAKTPLGIIALFVLLAEAIAAMVLSQSSHLNDVNQTIIVIFITVFPVLVVGMFWHLVVNHNVKLYSPSEFPNQDDFLAANQVNPAHLLEEFKKDVISEIERKSKDASTPVTSSDVEQQAIEYARAVEFLEKYRLSEKEVRALVALSEEPLDNEQAMERYGKKVVEKLKSLDLVNFAASGAATTTIASELAKLLTRLF